MCYAIPMLKQIVIKSLGALAVIVALGYTGGHYSDEEFVQSPGHDVDSVWTVDETTMPSCNYEDGRPKMITRGCYPDEIKGEWI